AYHTNRLIRREKEGGITDNPHLPSSLTEAMRIPGLKSGPRKPENDIFIVHVDDKNDQLEDSFLLRGSICLLAKAFIFGVLCFVVAFVLAYFLLETRDELQQDFTKFMEIYGKSYESEEKMDEAYAYFRENMFDLERERSRQPGVEFGFHQWMDQHFSTFSQKFSLGDRTLPPMEGVSRFEGFEERVNRPGEFSLKDKATPVKNQGSCGSCWAFATVASVETANAIAGNPLVALSEQEMIECDTRNTGCRGGVRSYAMSFVKDNGLVPESTYPYTAKEGEQCHIGNTTKVYIKDWRLLSQSEDAMADWLFKTGPITFGMNVTKSMYSYRSGVFRPTEADCSTKSEGSHALTLMGYGSERGQDYWLVKNSWGDYWGDGGYFKLARGANVCGMANNVVAPMF
ncbi:hypothetical protein PENTCL1PPCAC_25968, partial [Pristionchus entomophagus]